MNAIEAVAIAAYQEFWRDDNNSLLQDMTPEQREASLMEWRRIARAALTALRDCDPSEAMWQAVEGESNPYDAFRAMLDAALTEP